MNEIAAELTKGLSPSEKKRFYDNVGLPEPEPNISDWEDPVLFGEYNLPEFPSEIYPTWLRGMVEGVAISTQTPADLAGVLVVSVLSCVLAKKFVIKVREDWQEPLNTYSMVALDPGNRKSAVFAIMTEPLTEFERLEADKSRPVIAEKKTRKEIMEKTLQKLKDEITKPSNKAKKVELEYEAVGLAQEIEEYEVPAIPRLTVDDCTSEKLKSLLCEHDGRIAVLSPEGLIFEIMAGKYSKNGSSDIDIFLKGHSGDDVRVDRVGRPTEFVKNPALTIGLAVQPEIIKGLMNRPEYRGRGLLGRFIYSLPQSPVGYRVIRTNPIPGHVKNAYVSNISKLLNIGWLNTEHDPYCLEFDYEAEQLFNRFEADLEPKLRPFEELGNMTDWGGKLAGAVARTIGLLHIAENVNSLTPWSIRIDRDTVQRGLLLGDYLKAHSKAVYAEMGADKALDDAKYILEWIKHNQIVQFTKREVHRATQGRIKRSADLDPVLQVLTDRNFIRLTETETSKVGRPSELFEVNSYMTKLTKLTKPPVKSNFVNNVNIVTKKPDENLAVDERGGVIEFNL